MYLGIQNIAEVARRKRGSCSVHYETRNLGVIVAIAERMKWKKALESL